MQDVWKVVGNGIENVDPVTGYNMNTVSLSALVAKGITSFDQDSTTYTASTGCNASLLSLENRQTKTAQNRIGPAVYRETS